jgi:hypothetical protein
VTMGRRCAVEVSLSLLGNLVDVGVLVFGGHDCCVMRIGIGGLDVRCRERKVMR